MKRIAKLSTLLIIVVFFILSCNKSDENLPAENIQLTEFSHSNCKDENLKISNDEKLILKANGSEKLSITHVNVMFNCCPIEIKAKVEITDNIITIREEEIGALCNCICPYDLNLTLSDLRFKKYTIKVIKMGDNHFEHRFLYHSGLNLSIPIN